MEISRRDYFAGLAMKSMIQDSALRHLFAKKGELTNTSWMDIASENAFYMADSMLKKENELLDTLKGLVSDVGNLLSEYDIEWQQAGYYNHAKELIKKVTK